MKPGKELHLVVRLTKTNEFNGLVSVKFSNSDPSGQNLTLGTCAGFAPLRVYSWWEPRERGTDARFPPDQTVHRSATPEIMLVSVVARVVSPSKKGEVNRLPRAPLSALVVGLP
jgi:hypothetical protein